MREVSDRLPTVVVGAGIVGICTALHVAQRRANVLVIDAGLPAAGTTPAGAGFVALWASVDPRWGPGGLIMEQYSLDFYRELSRESDVGLRANGNVGFYSTEDGLRAGVGAALASPYITPSTRIVSPAEIARLSGGMVDPNRVAGGVLMPDGIQLETGLALAAVTERARAAGVTLRYETRVEQIVLQDGGAVAVKATSGEIPTATVVLATGAWLNQLVVDLGWRLPLAPFVAVRLITAPVGVPATMPSFQGHDLGLWIRESAGGFTWGTTLAYAPAQRLADSPLNTAPGRTIRSAELVRRQHADTARIAEVLPALGGAPVIAERQGMPVYTPDRQFIIGQIPTCRNVWVAGGDNEAGISHAPGIGRLIADMITGVEPICDPTPYRPDRFDPAAYPNEDCVGATLRGTLDEAFRRTRQLLR